MSRIQNPDPMSRRKLLQTGAGLAGGALLPSALHSAGVRSRRSSAGRHLAGRFVRGFRHSSASRCRAPAPMRCRAKMSSRAGSSRSSTSTPAMS